MARGKTITKHPSKFRNQVHCVVEPSFNANGKVMYLSVERCASLDQAQAKMAAKHRDGWTDTFVAILRDTDEGRFFSRFQDDRQPQYTFAADGGDDDEANHG